VENILKLRVNRLRTSVSEIQFPVRRVFNAGWAGSDRAAIQHHIDELAQMGVPAPRLIPTLFALGNHLLTTSDAIQVHGDKTSGEVEYVLLKHEDELYVTVGSDHTDRRLEAHSIPKAKNMCLNVMARDVWPYEEVKNHFARLKLTCWVLVDGKRSLYQKDVCSALLPPEYWLDDLETRIGGFGAGTVLFSGTIGTVAGLVVSDSYEFQMTDRVLNRTISHKYDCEVLSGAIEDY
jgi:hypothetical protein